MKTKSCLIAFISVTISMTSFSQRNVGMVNSNMKLPRKIDAIKRVNRDTLLYQQWGGAWTPILYGVAGGGYIFGVNKYSDKEKCQSFITGDLHPGVDHVLEGAVIWFGAKQLGSGDPNSKVVVNARKLDGGTTSSSGTIAPGTLLGSVDLLMSDVDTSDYTYITFATPIFMSAATEYAICINLESIKGGDTTGMVSSSDNEYVVPGLSWEQYPDSTWHTINGGWTNITDMTAFIAPAIDLDMAVDEIGRAIAGLSFHPNPVRKYADMRYILKEHAEVSLKVTDLAGKKLLEKTIEKQHPGNHNYRLDTGDLTDGMYMVTLSVGNFSTSARVSVVNN